MALDALDTLSTDEQNWLLAEVSKTFAAVVKPDIPGVERFATRLPGSALTYKSSSFSYAGTMRAFDGNAKVEQLSQADFEITSSLYQDGIFLDKRHIQADRTGYLQDVLSIAVPQLAQKTQATIASALYKLVDTCQATNTSQFDGQYIVDTDHSWPMGYGTSQSNKGTAAFADSALKAAFEAMRGFKDPSGDPLLVQEPNVLMVPNALYEDALDVIRPRTVSTGGENRLEGIVDVIRNPYMTETNDWYLMDCSGVIKPMVYYIPTFGTDGLANPRIEINDVKNRNRYEIYVWLDYAVAWSGLWWLVYGSTGGS